MEWEAWNANIESGFGDALSREAVERFLQTLGWRLSIYSDPGLEKDAHAYLVEIPITGEHSLENLLEEYNRDLEITMGRSFRLRIELP